MMADASIKVFYFNLKGRAECIRLLLAAAGKTFDDVRFSREDWPKYKPDAPFGQSPYVEIDGVKYGQSVAILQYLAREFGFYGASNMEAFAIDRVIHLVQDLVPLGGRLIHEADQQRKAELMKEMKEVASVRFFGYIEQILKDNGGGYVAGSKLTLGDLCIFDLCNCGLKAMLADLFPYPLIQALVARVGQQEGVHAYLASRPDTPM